MIQVNFFLNWTRMKTKQAGKEQKYNVHTEHRTSSSIGG